MGVENFVFLAPLSERDFEDLFLCLRFEDLLARRDLGFGPDVSTRGEEELVVREDMFEREDFVAMATRTCKT